MLDPHPLRGLGIPELERGQEARDRRSPGQLALVDELREQQGREPLGVRSDHVEGVGIDPGRAAQLAKAEPAGEHDPAVLDDADRHSGHAGRFLAVFHEPGQRGDPRPVQLVGLPAREGLARIALRQQPVEDEGHLGAAFLADRLRHVVDPDRPHAARELHAGGDVAALVGRGLISEGALLRPAVLVGSVVRDLQGPLDVLVGGPAGQERRLPLLGANVDQHDPRVALRRFENRRRATDRHAPPRRRDEGVAEHGRHRRVRGQAPPGRCRLVDRSGSLRRERPRMTGRQEDQSRKCSHGAEDSSI